MAGIKDLAEKLNSVHVKEVEMPILDNIESNSFSSSNENIKESDNGLVKGDDNKTTPDILELNSSADNINQVEIGARISNNISKDSSTIDGQILEENPDFSKVKNKENTTKTASDKKEYLEETNSEIVNDPHESIIIDIQKYMFSDCSLNCIESKNLLEISQKVRKYLHLFSTQLEEIYRKLLNQKQELKLIIVRILLSSINEVLSIGLSDNIEQIIQETRNVFFQYIEVNEKCQFVLIAILQKIESRLQIEKVQRNILEEHNDYVSTLEGISLKKSHLKSSIEFTKEFKILVYLSKRPAQNPESRIGVHITAIEKAVSAYKEMYSFQKGLDKIFDCIEFCLR